MAKRKRPAQRTPPAIRANENQAARSFFAYWMQDGEICAPGYVTLDKIPEIQTACLCIAELVASMPIHILENTPDGDRRIENELSRMLDITPNRNMSRINWLTAIVMNLLLYGRGNSIVVPHTHNGFLESMEPISHQRVELMPVSGSYRDYQVLIDGQPHDPAGLMHFVFNPDPVYLWRGQGTTVTLKSIADNLNQAQKTKNAFMKSEWKPSVIVKVSGMTAEMAQPEKRAELLRDYVHPAEPGTPWLVPGEVFDVEQIRPLSLADLAINDTVTLDKRTVAAVVGVPAFMLGVGAFNRDEWNSFIQGKVRTVAQIIQQEMTRALITSPKWYVWQNVWSLMDYDMKSVSDILLAGSDRGYVNGDEWRERVHMPPAGLKERRILENYIPYDMSAFQKKLLGSGIE